MKFDNKVVYQIYPKSFLDTNADGIGDLQGIIEKLDYLQQLGVDYIWISPINTSPQYDNGYDIADYYGIDPMFGTIEDYQQLIAQANERGIKVMLDLVLNHTSDEHEWFKKAVAGDPKYMDYYIWRDQPNDIKSFFSKQAWTYNEQVGKYYFHLFDQHQPDLNWENEEVRNEIYKMINYWIDLGVEGFRLDVIDLIGKEPDKYITGKGPKFYDYLNELHNATFGDKLLTVGECWNSTLAESHKMCDNNGLTQVFHFTHLIQTNGEDKWEQNPIDYSKIVDILKLWHNDYDGSQTIVMNNHDMPRLVSLWLNDSEYRYESATLLATLFSLLKGTQYIYQGEELGMTNAYLKSIDQYNDVETLNKYEEFKKEGKYNEEQIMEKIALISRDNARTPMQWTAEENAGFSTGTPWLAVNKNYREINAQNDLASDNSVYKFYQKVISFKKENFEQIINQPLDAISFENNLLSYQKGSIKVTCNMQAQPTAYETANEIIINNYQTYDNQFLQPYQAIVEKI